MSLSKPSGCGAASVFRGTTAGAGSTRDTPPGSLLEFRSDTSRAPPTAGGFGVWATANARIHALIDLLAEHEFGVGYFYMRKGSPGAALARFATLEERFPEYGAKDKLLFYEGEVLARLGRHEEAAIEQPEKRVLGGDWAARHIKRCGFIRSACRAAPCVMRARFKIGQVIRGRFPACPSKRGRLPLAAPRARGAIA